MLKTSDAATTAVEERSPSLLADWATLTKLRITVFAAVSAGVAALASRPDVGLGRAAEAALWVGLTSAAACVFNQVLERDVDALMERTRLRPLPAGRVGVRDAVIGGALLALLGVGLLAWRFNLLVALLALGTLAAYVLVYTPLKRFTTFNTLVGAVPGAMPPLLGACALAGTPGVIGLSLFATLFVWQFPHFFAIAWLYREDYQRAGMRMLASVPGTAGVAGRASLLHALCILPVSLLPVLQRSATLFYALVATGLGALYVLAAGAFARRESERSARRLLHVSLLYLPLLLAVLLIDRLVLLPAAWWK
jgi:protoheme IX farnesyltransferase